MNHATQKSIPNEKIVKECVVMHRKRPAVFFIIRDKVHHPCSDATLDHKYMYNYLPVTSINLSVFLRSNHPVRFFSKPWHIHSLLLP